MRRLRPARKPAHCGHRVPWAEREEEMMAKVAFLGLGVMGYPMAGHLKNKGGHEVTVYNRTAAKAEAWAKEFGGRAAATPKEAAAGQDFVMMRSEEHTSELQSLR